MEGYSHYVDESYGEAKAYVEKSIEVLNEAIELINDDTSAVHIELNGIRSSRIEVLKAVQAEIDEL